jgi:hypothetical protein
MEIPPDHQGVRAARRAGWRWVVTDLQIIFGGFDRPEDRFATGLWIADGRPSVLTVPYSNVALAQAVLEQDLRFADARSRLRDLESHGPRLHIFDLNAAAHPPRAPAGP